MLPAATTTVSPDDQAASTAADNGSFSYRTGASTPSDRLSTDAPTSSWLTTTQPMPAMTFDRLVDPSAPATFTEMMRAAGATPLWAGPLPAMSPAMNVPWP